MEPLVAWVMTHPFKLGVEVAEDTEDVIVDCRLFVDAESRITSHHDIESALPGRSLGLTRTLDNTQPSIRTRFKADAADHDYHL